ncbi:MAG: hypothetical protein ABGX23_02070 [Nautiliaceae bacterium]
MQELNWAYDILKNYMLNYKFTFSKNEIESQYPDEFYKRFN